MPWVKLDTGFARHPKVIRLSDREFRAHIMAMCWVGEARTNGHIPPEALPVIMATRRTAERLVAAGLWELNGNGWEIHGWLDFNPSKEADEERRRRDAERQARWRQSRRDKKRDKTRDVTDESLDPPARVDPTRPDPSPQDGSEGGSVGLGLGPPPDPPPQIMSIAELEAKAAEGEPGSVGRMAWEAALAARRREEEA